MTNLDCQLEDVIWVMGTWGYLWGIILTNLTDEERSSHHGQYHSLVRDPGCYKMEKGELSPACITSCSLTVGVMWSATQTPASVTSCNDVPHTQPVSQIHSSSHHCCCCFVVLLLSVFLGGWESGNFNTTARITKTQSFALISSLSLCKWRSWYSNVCGLWCELDKAPLWKDVVSDSLRERNLCLNYGHSTRPDPLPLLMPQVRGANYTALGRGPAFSTSLSVSPSSRLTS